MTTPSIRANAAAAQARFGLGDSTTEAYLFATTADQIVAQYAAGAPIADTTGPFVIVAAMRTVRVVLTGGGSVATVYTVTGTAQDGSVQTETISASGAGTFEGVKMWQTITAFSSDVNPGGTTDLRCSAYAYDPPTRSIYVATTAGTVVVRPADGMVDVTYTVTSFSRHRICAKWIRLSSTATPIIAER